MDSTASLNEAWWLRPALWQVQSIVVDPVPVGTIAAAARRRGAARRGVPVEPASDDTGYPAIRRGHGSTRALTHSGDADPTRHVGNAAVPTDSRGTRVYKESKHSTTRIDLAVCAIMAHAAAISGNAEQQVWCSRRRHETTPWAVSDRGRRRFG